LAGPHQDQPVLEAGEPLERAHAAVIMVHGRGASARDILTIAAEVDAAGFAFLAPEAAGGAWYPNRFMEPIPGNEPWLSSALELLESILARVGERIPAEQVILLGFSQGACLALEFAARHARRYGGLVGLSGGLIGPDGTPRDYPGSLAGTPVFLGCSDVDPHIPATRVEESGRILAGLGGEVTVKLYPGLGHDVNPDEIRNVRVMMAALPRHQETGRTAEG
jgi:predicted esterase